MTTDAQLAADARAVTEAVRQARAGLVDREVLADVVVLCAVAGEHLLVIGPPGTAKSEAVRRVAARLGGSYFEYLLGRFTEPTEVFGPVDLQRLRDGVVEVRTEGMLPEADVAFLDEVFLGSTAILNTLLALLNERTFRRGSTTVRSPLRLCVGAANRLPDDPALDAFADRFLARVFVDPVADARLEELLEAGWSLGDAAEAPSAVGATLLPALDRLADAARSVDLYDARGAISAAVRRLRAAGIALTDRRVVRAQRLVAAAAALDGRRVARAGDLWVLPLVAPTQDAQVLSRETLTDVLGDTGSAGLAHAAEELSRGPLARAERMADDGRRLLARVVEQAVGAADDSARADTRLRVEAALREIDAAFDAAHLPDPLREVRAGLVGALARAGSPGSTETDRAIREPSEPATTGQE